MHPDRAPPIAGDAEDHVASALARLPHLLDSDPRLVARGRFLSVDCLIGTQAQAVHLRIVEGRIVGLETGPRLMASWHFAYRATPEAWTAFWQPLPKPGWHDLLALTKRGAARLEGQLHPFIANLQYFKDLLALPRGEARP
ncbi:MAG: hypothetical protein B7Y70_03600 [Rhizobiales bacterium 35-68-8]|nr:MAG: hypothetical protein B7Y70_03600 [Rhizobiales bacterium 35-68-8]